MSLYAAGQKFEKKKSFRKFWIQKEKGEIKTFSLFKFEIKQTDEILRTPRLRFHILSRIFDGLGNNPLGIMAKCAKKCLKMKKQSRYCVGVVNFSTLAY